MAHRVVKRISIPVNAEEQVSGILQVPSNATCCFVFAHGAGAGMEHPYMQAVTDGLAKLSVATLRYQFPYSEKGSGRPDPPKLCHATVRGAVAAAHDHLPTLPLFAGGKSFGGRMTSQAQAASALPHVRGLCFFGFPLHPPKKLSTARADHLAQIHIPMLFLQGTRDALADWTLMQSVVDGLASPVTLERVEHADHSFHVPVRSGRTDADVMHAMLLAFTAWTHSVLSHRSK